MDGNEGRSMCAKMEEKDESRAMTKASEIKRVIESLLDEYAILAAGVGLMLTKRIHNLPFFTNQTFKAVIRFLCS